MSDRTARRWGRLVLALALAWVVAPSSLDAQSDRQPPRRSGRPSGEDPNWRAAPDARDGERPAPRRQPVERFAGRPADRAADASESPGRAPDPHLDHGPQVWREYDLAPYTGQLAIEPHPEQTVVEWVLRQTGLETWHGEEVAVLCATRGKLKVFQTPDVQERVAEITARFTQPVQQQVSMRLELIACGNLGWRNGLAHLLKPVAFGPDGQQAWLVAPEDAALVRERLRSDRQARTITEQQILIENGRPAKMETLQTVNYIAGLELMPGAYLAYQPVVGRLQEGVRATLAPLWLVDGSGVDLDLKLETRAVARLHDARSAAPLATGNQAADVQVPEVSATTFASNIRWPTQKVLLVSTAVQPGLFPTRRGMLGLSGLGASTELLFFAELDRPMSSRSAGARPITRAPAAPRR